MGGLENPLTVLKEIFITRIFASWKILIILVIAIIIWIIIRNNDMKERNGEGFFDNIFEGDWDPREWFK